MLILIETCLECHTNKYVMKKKVDWDSIVKKYKFDYLIKSFKWKYEIKNIYIMILIFNLKKLKIFMISIIKAQFSVKKIPTNKSY